HFLLSRRKACKILIIANSCGGSCRREFHGCDLTRYGPPSTQSELSSRLIGRGEKQHERRFHRHKKRRLRNPRRPWHWRDGQSLQSPQRFVRPRRSHESSPSQSP